MVKPGGAGRLGIAGNRERVHGLDPARDNLPLFGEPLPGGRRQVQERVGPSDHRTVGFHRLLHADGALSDDVGQTWAVDKVVLAERTPTSCREGRRSGARFFIYRVDL